ncbi:hypothetical protein [Chondrinema litorale]|uniref:hypothetical protein n=1 Tax=Chondrinema litorale TaxID=2994555 RepID=UPI0025429E9A|nr:hypothetical protein [Chondrinema litorale]UZR95329.1 hypothetical protein OQ292_05780 [Chondrinema litorale]
MKKKSKKQIKTIDALIVSIAIVLTIWGITYFLKNRKSKSVIADNSTDNISSFTQEKNSVVKTDNTPIAFKEVNNSYFAENPYAFSTVDKLNIRESPGNGKVIKQVNKGSYIGKHTGKSTDIGTPTSPGRWAKLQTDEGEAWVFSGFIESKESQQLSGLNQKIKVIA